MLFLWLSLSGLHLARSREIQPTLHGPGFRCEAAFPDDSLTLDSVLLCNKTVNTLYYNKTEVQVLDTTVLRLGEGQCEEFQGKGFRYD